jgi:WhiB family redox-sensing transcriptional regulator
VADRSALPGPIADLYEWQFAGSCRASDPALFFPPESARGPARRKREDAARAICSNCPVLEACRAHGLRVREPYGVWGGLSEDERAEIYAARRRQRRPNHALRIVPSARPAPVAISAASSPGPI